MSIASKFILSLCAVGAGVIPLAATSTCVHAQNAAVLAEQDEPDEVQREGAWDVIRRKGEGLVIMRRTIELAPKSETKPALSLQFIPNEFHRKEGNAAIFYLQALGFFEQSNASRAKQDFEQKSREAAITAGDDTGTYPPYSWMASKPSELPIDEVKQYLAYTAFQPRYLAEAVMRKDFELDRRIQEVDNPIGYLLPEVQSMRELARQQQLRFLLAIAEGRIDDAVSIVGQQLALGSHLGQDHFLVTSLVGMACAGIGLSDAYHLCEQDDAPNMYWAVATLPNPLVDLRPAIAFERELLFLQFKRLAEVDETPKPEGYWKDFVVEMTNLINELQVSDNLASNSLDESIVTLAIAMGYPGAERYLREVVGMEQAALDQLSKTQVFVLAMRRDYERTRDEMFKSFFAPAKQKEIEQRASTELQGVSTEYGWINAATGLLLPAVQAAQSAQRRIQQQLAMLQTVEAIRHHLATHAGALPETLDVLELPAPLDPATDQPFNYELKAGEATLSGGAFPGIRYQLILRGKR